MISALLTTFFIGTFQINAGSGYIEPVDVCFARCQITEVNDNLYMEMIFPCYIFSIPVIGLMDFGYKISRPG